MTLDLDKLSRIAERLYLPTIARIYGNGGVEALKEVLISIRQIYSYLEPELIKGTLLIFKRLNGDDIDLTLSAPTHLSSPETLAQLISTSEPQGTILVQLQTNGKLLIWRGTSADPHQLSKDGIVYLYREEREFFLASGEEHEVINPSRVHASVFAIPTFKRLKEALEDYKARSIRTSRCEIFAEAWHGGPNSHRLFFRNAPEEIMRRSLAQFLRNVLRDAEVRQEQPVDDSHPVDIKVTWMFTNRQALIEIKWIGKSLSSEDKVTSYSDSRARAGAQQLAGYLDKNRTDAPTHQAVGYLVIIDGRRYGLQPSSTDINYEDGMHYSDREISFDPVYHEIRRDFSEPIRMFAEPICSVS